MLTSADIAAYLPHTGAMCLLNNVISIEEKSLIAEATINHEKPSPLYAQNKLGVFCLIEWGAQASGLHLGLCGDKSRQQKHRGYLIQVN